MLGWLARYPLELELTVDAMGVGGTLLPAVCRCVERAVRGVGPEIKLFLGVSGIFLGVSVTVFLLLELLNKLLELLDGGAGLAGFNRRDWAMNGCRSAGAGLRRRSGSHCRHFAMKSRKTSS